MDEDEGDQDNHSVAWTNPLLDEDRVDNFSEENVDDFNEIYTSFTTRLINAVVNGYRHKNNLASSQKPHDEFEVCEAFKEWVSELDMIIQNVEQLPLLKKDSLSLSDLPPDILACLTSSNVPAIGQNIAALSSSSSGEDEPERNDRLQSLLQIRGYGVVAKKRGASGSVNTTESSSKRKRPDRIEEKLNETRVDLTGEQVRAKFDEDWRKIMAEDIGGEGLMLLYHPRAIYEKHAEKYQRLKEANRLDLLTKRDKTVDASNHPILIKSKPPVKIIKTVASPPSEPYSEPSLPSSPVSGSVQQL